VSNVPIITSHFTEKEDVYKVGTSSSQTIKSAIAEVTSACRNRILEFQAEREVNIDSHIDLNGLNSNLGGREASRDESRGSGEQTERSMEVSGRRLAESIETAIMEMASVMRDIHTDADGTLSGVPTSDMLSSDELVSRVKDFLSHLSLRR